MSASPRHVDSIDSINIADGKTNTYRLAFKKIILQTLAPFENNETGVLNHSMLD